MLNERQTHAWASTIEEFLNTPKHKIEQSLHAHLLGLLGTNPSGSQIDAWSEEIDILRVAFRDLVIAETNALKWSLIMEYELPLEGGRRPDVVVLGFDTIFVMEFKQGKSINQAAIDQVAAYARDLSEYHSKSHGVSVIPILVPTKISNVHEKRAEINIISPSSLSAFLEGYPPGRIMLVQDWLCGEYAPLPTLIAAAKMIFNNERLPSIKRAESYGVGKAVEKLREIANTTHEESGRTLALVSGVPGAGKTLVGLQMVYSSVDLEADAIFLSGNGPLVEVLRDALKSKAFVSDLHAFIKSYGTTSKIPKQHIIVFDEAQRAWDKTNMLIKKSIPKSEPELLFSIGEKVPDWAMLVGLVGHGQEIHTGEESGISGWVDALSARENPKTWKIFIPPRFSANFEGMQHQELEELDLDRTLRSKQAEQIHTWVENLLSGHLSEASKYAQSIWIQNFPIFVTRDLDTAKNYVNSRFEEEISKRYGLLASSKDRVLPKYGINNGFHDTKRVKTAKWYNQSKGEDGSCCNLNEVVTEFGCQGLELDMAIVAWGNDLIWDGKQWAMRNIRTRIPQQDPHQLRVNSYRVLLTRSREGLIVFIPPEKEFDQTEHALLAAGARILLPQIKLAATS